MIKVSFQDEYLQVLTKGGKQVIHYYRNLTVDEMNADMKLPADGNTELKLRDAEGKLLRIITSFEQGRMVCNKIDHQTGVARES